MSFDLLILNGDLVINNSDLATVNGKNKLIQDLLKIALTTAGSNPLQPWYGSLVGSTLIGSILDSDIVISVAQNQLQNAINNLKSLQNMQAATGQIVTPDEQIAFVKNVSIVRNTVDPRLFQVSINVLNKAFGTVSANFTATNS